MGLHFKTAGLLTTIQDTGRYGFQKDGMPVSGAMDRLALRIANILTGNKENEAAIEITLTGPEILFEADLLVAITGAGLLPHVNGQPAALWKPLLIRKGSLLTFGRQGSGCRVYLAVAGGLDVPLVMNSASTCLSTSMGGWKGRAIGAGDYIPAKGLAGQTRPGGNISGMKPVTGAFSQARWSPSPLLLPPYSGPPVIRFVHGPEFDWFSDESKNHFLKEEFLITSQSNRMGYRLEGPPLQLNEKKELLSSAVTFGTVQIPAGGSPIVLMAGHATTGGYPRIAQIITADLPLLAQLPPGKRIRFKIVSLPEAQQLLIEQEKKISFLKKAINLKTGIHERFFS